MAGALRRGCACGASVEVTEAALAGACGADLREMLRERPFGMAGAGRVGRILLSYEGLGVVGCSDVEWSDWLSDSG
jgi:hypothetical protein